MMQNAIKQLSQPQILALLHWAIAAVLGLLSAIVGIGGWILRNVFRIANKKTTDALAKLDKIEEATTVAATNHLATIEKETLKHTEILTDLKVGQAEMNGRIGTLCDI